MRLAALDVALTEAAVGGVTGVLLLRAAARLCPREALREAPRAGLRAAAALLCALVSASLAVAVLSAPDPAPTLAPAAAAGLAATGLGNPVTGVLLAYRALDTLLEKVVLLLAVLGVWSLAPDALWGGRPGPRPARSDDALAVLAQILAPIGIVVGVYLLWTGADEPGGAFQGGAILAAMWILARMAGLVDAPAVGGRALRLALVVGPAVFLAVGLAGFALGGAFLALPASRAKALIVALEVPLTISIAATLALLVEGPPARERR